MKPRRGGPAHSCFERGGLRYRQCGASAHQRSLITGTIFESSKLPLSHRLLAVAVAHPVQERWFGAGSHAPARGARRYRRRLPRWRSLRRQGRPRLREQGARPRGGADHALWAARAEMHASAAPYRAGGRRLHCQATLPLRPPSSRMDCGASATPPWSAAGSRQALAARGHAHLGLLKALRAQQRGGGQRCRGADEGAAWNRSRRLFSGSCAAIVPPASALAIGVFNHAGYAFAP